LSFDAKIAKVAKLRVAFLLPVFYVEREQVRESKVVFSFEKQPL